MKITAFALWQFLAMIAVAAPVQAQSVIDFNSPPASGSATYTVSGVIFSTVVPTGSLQFLTSPNNTNALIGGFSTGLPELRADFLSALTGTVSVDLGDYGGDPDLLFLQLFDASNTSLGFTSLLTTSSDTTLHTLSLSGANIAYAIFGARPPSLSGSSALADNFTFISTLNVSAIPEPATWAMTLIGFGAIGVVLRRRRSTRNLHQAA